jgi:hypothetical protein
MIVRGLLLYLRTRNALAVVLGLGLVSGVYFAAGHALTSRLMSGQYSLVGLLLWGPAAVATLVGTVLHARMLELEQTASRRMRPWMAGLLGGLTIVAVAALLPTGLLGGDAYGVVNVLRNVAGLIGITLLVAPMVGSGSAWVTPVLYGLAVNLIGGRTVTPPLWKWPLRQATDTPAIEVAIGLFVVGSVATLVNHWRAQRPSGLGGG